MREMGFPLRCDDMLRSTVLLDYRRYLLSYTTALMRGNMVRWRNLIVEVERGERAWYSGSPHWVYRARSRGGYNFR